jgi:hypothetical protein
MRWLKRTCLLLLLIGCTMICAQESDNLMPLEVGTKWTYRVRDQKELFILIAAKEEKVGEQVCIRLEGKIEKDTVSNEHLAVLKDGIYRFKVDENLISPPVCVVKLPGKKGEKWTNEFKVNNKPGKVSYSIDLEDIEVPAGKFKDAILVVGEIKENNGTNISKTWYAPNVGMVKQVIESGKESVTLELEKIEKPKK